MRISKRFDLFAKDNDGNKHRLKLSANKQHHYRLMIMMMVMIMMIIVMIIQKKKTVLFPPHEVPLSAKEAEGQNKTEGKKKSKVNNTLRRLFSVIT
jgi:hypothetical protein